MERYLGFVRALAVNRTCRLGIVLVTSSFIILVLLELARLLGIMTNPYVGLVTYQLFPALFILGLILIPIGWHQFRRNRGISMRELLSRQFEPEAVEGRFSGSRLFRTIGGLTALNVIFMAVLSMEVHHFMDGPEFCGTACHVMNPEWTTYQASPHARVKCVDCHVGEGMNAFINSKINGMWQVLSITFKLYDRPIPTPVHQLRPARETCEKCHWPEKLYGTHLRTFARYRLDETSTRTFTTLNMKVDAGQAGGRSGIHWHISPENEVRYSSVDDMREAIRWVEVRSPEGAYHRYENRRMIADGTVGREDPKGRDIRVMDCVDCHNRATHIYEPLEDAVDSRIRAGLLDSALPYLKREAMGALLNRYNNRAEAFTGIEKHIERFYRQNYPELAGQRATLLDSTVQVLRDIYRRNIHPEMKITWDSYPSHIGHRGNTGCFRCHNSNMVDSVGLSIPDECTLCHSILSYDRPQPFQFLQPADPNDVEYLMQLYLQKEFLNSFVD
jgi:hypothetical protein